MLKQLQRLDGTGHLLIATEQNDKAIQMRPTYSQHVYLPETAFIPPEIQIFFFFRLKVAPENIRNQT